MKEKEVKVKWKCPKCHKINWYKAKIEFMGIRVVIPGSSKCKCGLDRFSGEYYKLMEKKGGEEDEIHTQSKSRND